MSFDLGVWHSSRSMTVEDAERYYGSLCDREVPGSPGVPIEPHPAVNRFVTELQARYPDLSEFKHSDLYKAAWAANLDISSGHCIMTIKYSHAEEVYEFAKDLARKLGLYFWDPQSVELSIP